MGKSNVRGRGQAQKKKRAEANYKRERVPGAAVKEGTNSSAWCFENIT